MTELSEEFIYLKDRIKIITDKFIENLIALDNEALAENNELPKPDVESIAAYRMLIHGELEYYFESKAKLKLNKLQNDFKKDLVMTSEFLRVILIYLHSQNYTQIINPDNNNNARNVYKNLASEALGFANNFIKNNNGIKEDSVSTLSAIIGRLPDELDQLMLDELDSYGKRRGDVAHQSVVAKTVYIDSPLDEKNKVLSILNLIENSFENEGNQIKPKINKFRVVLNNWFTNLIKKFRFASFKTDKKS